MATKIFALAGFLALAQASAVPYVPSSPIPYVPSGGIVIPSDLPDGYYSAVIDAKGQQSFQPVNIAISGSVINTNVVALPSGISPSCEDRSIADATLLDSLFSQFYTGCAGLVNTELPDNRAFLYRKGESVAYMCNYGGASIIPQASEWLSALDLIKTQCGATGQKVGYVTIPNTQRAYGYDLVGHRLCQERY